MHSLPQRAPRPALAMNRLMKSEEAADDNLYLGVIGSLFHLYERYEETSERVAQG